MNRNNNGSRERLDMKLKAMLDRDSHDQTADIDAKE